MKKLYFLEVKNGNSRFYRGLWNTMSEAQAWAYEYHCEYPQAEFTVEIMQVMWNVEAVRKW